MNPLLEDISTLKGVGPKSGERLNRLGISKISDLLHYYPRSYETIEGLTRIEDLKEDRTSYIRGVISSQLSLSRFQGRTLIRFSLEDESASIQVLFFNQPYLKKQWHEGDSLILKGNYHIKNGRRTFTNPQKVSPKEFELLDQIRLKPVYSLTKGINLKQLTDYIRQALHLMDGAIKDYLDEDIREKYGIASLSYAYERIHYPMDDYQLELARRRLAFDEFFLFQMAIKQVKEHVKKTENQFDIQIDPQVKRFLNQLPFRLTSAQERALKDVFKDMSGPNTMMRLIQGDVGSGKTIVAMTAMLNVGLQGYQSSLMVPTEVLAKQHYHSFSTLLEPFGIKTELLIGSMTPKQKRESIERLVSGQAQILIGTHALIQEHVEFKDLALVITDEQHRFGVLQRDLLSEKGNLPHTIVMSATPIPRTLSLILYGDLDMSIIDELPSGRKPIHTSFVNSSYRKRYLDFAIKEVREGHSVYIVCPMVENNEKIQAQSVEAYFELVSSYFPSDIKIGILHGRMKAKDKNEIMQDFLDYDIQVLVSTTVIEVGVNVPNATIMIIENAERFGLAQLHQLRGRVGRSSIQSYCVLVSDTKSSETRKKLKFIRDHEDGFELAEYDLKTRGPGNAFGTEQSGMPFFRVADIYKDHELLVQATGLASETSMNPSIERQLELFYYQLDTIKGI